MTEPTKVAFLGLGTMGAAIKYMIENNMLMQEVDRLLQ